jgi:ATP-binding cassette subfamily B (MDR/TAP) protein 1
MLKKYFEATQEAMEIATAILIKQGFFNGSMLGSFILLYAILSIYGSYLIYTDLEVTGCDPSAGNPLNVTCSNSGADVFGAMLGVAFAGQGISQVGSFLECFAAARVAAFEALTAINRKPGAPEETLYHEPTEADDRDGVSDTNKSSHSSAIGDLETPQGRVKAILPKYLIDATSEKGLKPQNVQGQLKFDNVKFHYPTRPGQQILNDFSVDIDAGKTIAFVGPRYVS